MTASAMQTALPPPPLNDRFAADVAEVQRIGPIRTVLHLLLRTSGLRFGVVARVTEDAWTACAVLDEMAFGMKPGDQLAIATTFCSVVQKTGRSLLIRHASHDPLWHAHPAPALYNVESYVAVPLRRRDGSFFGVLCAVDSRPWDLPPETLEVFEDLAELVSDQLQHEDELGARDRALLSARETAKLREQLIGIVSHDLRNPLTAIGLSAGSLLRRGALEASAAEAVRRIAASADRANRLIRDLLDFTQAKMGSGIPVHRRPSDVHELARQVLDELQPGAVGRTLTHARTGDGGAAVDPDRVAQVLANLLSNALQYSPPGTAVDVRTLGEEDAVVLEVENSGRPLRPELIPTLFQPMTRGEDGEQALVNASGRSIGLGLFIVDQIVRAHAGTVEVQSGQGGTTFRVRLPRR